MSASRTVLATLGALTTLLLFLGALALVGYEFYLVWIGRCLLAGEAWLAAIGAAAIGASWWTFIRAAFPEMES